MLASEFNYNVIFVTDFGSTCTNRDIPLWHMKGQSTSLEPRQKDRIVQRERRSYYIAYSPILYE